MHNWMRRFAFLPALLLALALPGCDQASAPDALVGPELSAPAYSSTSNGKAAVEGEDGEGYVGATLIGPLGGTFLIPGGHVLTVPAGAVEETVLFEATLYPKYMAVDLTATSATSLTKNDVGSKGFAVPVRLTLSYKQASRPVNVSSAAIAFDNPNGTLDPLASKVDEKNKAITAQLSHFSGYIIVD